MNESPDPVITRLEKAWLLSKRLQKSALLAMTFMVMITFLLTNLQALLWQSSDWLVGAVLPGVVASLTNEQREKYAVSPLSRSAVLDQAARLKAEHMASEEYFAHNSPGGITPWYWFDRVGYVYAYAGENLAVHFQDSDEVVKAWMNSPTHKANVIGSQYTEIGIGTAKGRYQGYDTVFVVQLFGTPAQKPVPVLVTVVNEVPKVSEGEVPAKVEIKEEIFSTTEITFKESIEVEPEAVVLSETTTLKKVATPDRDEAKTLSNEYFIATSSGLAPAQEKVKFVAGTTSPIFSELTTKPRTVLQVIYIFIGVLVLTLLLFSITLGYRTHQPKVIYVGVGLLCLMSLLFVWHVAVTSGAVIV